MGFDLLEKAVDAGRRRREAARLRMLERVEDALEQLAPAFGVSEAYLFGSIVRPGRFTDQSDVDLAIEDLGADYWSFLGRLSELVGREVDLVELAKCRFAARIRREGRRWTPKA